MAPASCGERSAAESIKAANRAAYRRLPSQAPAVVIATGLDHRDRLVREVCDQRIPPVHAPERDDQRDPKRIPSPHVADLVQQHELELLVVESLADPDDRPQQARCGSDLGVRDDANLRARSAPRARQTLTELLGPSARTPPLAQRAAEPDAIDDEQPRADRVQRRDGIDEVRRSRAGCFRRDSSLEQREPHARIEQHVLATRDRDHDRPREPGPWHQPHGEAQHGDREPRTRRRIR